MNLNNKKVIFIDVDQTLFDNLNNKLHDSTYEALKIISEREDVDLFLATGRSLSTLGHIQKVLPFFKGFVTSNGQTVTINNKTVYDKSVTINAVERLYEYVKKHNLSIATVLENEVYVNTLSEESRKGLARLHITKMNIIGDNIYKIKESIKQFWVFASESVLEQVRKEVLELDFVLWPYNEGCDAMLKGVTKHNGINYILNNYNENNNYYKYENTYAIGDGENDLGMFNVVNMPIAMGNAMEKAKKVAKYITDPIDQDGLYNALNHFFNLEK